MLAIIPPVAVVIFFQRWFVKGLTESLTQNSMSNDNALRCAW
jgi:ABC-type maltose transport system permease subunit